MNSLVRNGFKSISGKNPKISKPSFFPIGFMILFWGFTASLHPQTQIWLGGNTGDPSNWTDQNNWNPNSGYPDGPSSIAVFSGNSQGSVTIGGSVTVSGVSITSGSYNIDASGQTFSIQGFGVTNTGTGAETILTSGGAGGLNFNNNASAGNVDYLIASGTSLIFNNTSTSGNSSITSNSGGSVFFTGTAAGGAASFINNAGATFDISGLVAGSALTIGSIQGGGNIYLSGNSLVTGINNASTTVSGVIAGLDGSLTKLGTGTLTLSGSCTLGALAVNSGILDVVGSDSVYLAAVNGGLLAMGGSYGLQQLTLAGGTFESLGGPHDYDLIYGYYQSGGATLQLSLEAGGLSDSFSAPGGIHVDGILKITPYAGYSPQIGDSFTLFYATGALTGQFSTIINPFSNVRWYLFEFSSFGDLEAVPDSFAHLPDVHLTANQTSVGAALDNVYSDPGANFLIGYIGRHSEASLPSIYDQFSPAGLTPLYQIGFNLAQARSDWVAERLKSLWNPSGPSDTEKTAWNGSSGGGRPSLLETMPAGQEAQIASKSQNPESGWNLFVEETNQSGTINADSNTAGYQFNTTGFNAGADYRLDKNLAVGLLLGSTQSGSTASDGSVSVTGVQAGLYGGWEKDGYYAQALLDFGVNNYTTQRGVSWDFYSPTYGLTASGASRGIQYSGSLGGGYQFREGDLLFGPIASAQYTYVQVDSFTEQGSISPLLFPTQGEGSLRSQLGGEASRTWNWGGTVLTPEVRLAWEHEYLESRDGLTSQFAWVPGNNFTGQGPVIGQDMIAVEAGLSAQWLHLLSLYADYQGKFGLTNYNFQNFTAGINLAF